jgi:hypothetical protein
MDYLLGFSMMTRNLLQPLALSGHCCAVDNALDIANKLSSDGQT